MLHHATDAPDALYNRLDRLNIGMADIKHGPGWRERLQAAMGTEKTDGPGEQSRGARRAEMTTGADNPSDLPRPVTSTRWQFAALLFEHLRERGPEFPSAFESLSDCPDCAVFDRLLLDFDVRASQSVPATLADGREVGALYLVAVIREGCPPALRAVHSDLGVHDAAYAPA